MYLYVGRYIILCTYTHYFVDEFADQRVAHALERCGFDCLHCRAGIHFAGDIQSVRKSSSVVVPRSRVSV